MLIGLFSVFARRLFDNIPQRRNAFVKLFHSVNNECGSISIVNEHVRHGRFLEALKSFHFLNSLGQIKATKFTLCALLTCCTQAFDQCLGSQFHARIIQTGYENNIFLNSKLVDLYSKCNMMVDAKKVFNGIEEHDHVSWTSIVAGFAQNGYGREVIVMFKEMLATADIRPNCFTFATVISVSSETVASFHTQVIKFGCDCSNFVVSSLIDCYSKCGKMDEATLVYKGALGRDVILLNSMIAAYTHNLCGEKALQVFVEMRKLELTPSDYTFSSILNACASLAVLKQGRQIHCLIAKIGSGRSVYISSSLIDMYSKCGNVDEARCLFDQLGEKRNSILWTSMITGYANGGRGKEGLELFEEMMKQEDFRPDNICFTAALTACNHAGLVDRAEAYLEKMVSEYGLSPELDQYACMVDLYGKTGQLRKAKKMIEQMPFEANVVMWSSFLGSCRVYGEAELGREAGDELFKMDPYNAAHYVTLANIYAEAGLWEEALRVRRMMREKGIRKSVGLSWIEVEGRVHVFSVSDTSHPQLIHIYAELDKLTLETGYKPREDDSEDCVE